MATDTTGDERLQDGATERGQVSRRDVLRMGLGGAAAAVLGTSPLARAAEERGKKRPNVLFVFSDEHRWCSLPFTQMPDAVTPTFAQFAGEGTSFDRCISNCPICVPYRGMLMTGLWPQESRIGPDNRALAGVGPKEAGRTIGRYGLARTFREAGYVTGYVGKWHLVDDSVYGAGFDYHKDWLYGDDHWTTKWRDVPSKEEYRTYKDYNAIGMTDQTLDFVRQNAGGEQPFFMMLSWNPPHWRWDDAPEEFVDLYPEDRISYRPNVTPQYKEGKQLLYYRHYHAHISAIDAQMKRLLESLDELGIAENTIVVYTADHGSSFGSNGMYSKRNPYDESNRVPFLIRWPGHVPAKKRSDLLMGAIDIYPTLCGMTGIDPPAHCHGQDLSAAMLGRPCEADDSQFIFDVYCQANYMREQRNPGGHNWNAPYRGVETGRYTFAVDSRGKELLFDNVEDVYQMKNLADDPAAATIKAALAAQLSEWVRKAEDPYIPEEFRNLPLPERLMKLNEHYSWQFLEPGYERYKKGRLDEFRARTKSDAQREELASLCDRIFDRSAFAAINGVNSDLWAIRNKRPGTNPARLAAFEKEKERLEKPRLEQFRAEAEKILAEN